METLDRLLEEQGNRVLHYLLDRPDLDIDSSDKTRSIVNNAGRALVKKKVLMLGSKEIDTINSTYIFDTYRDPYLSKKEYEDPRYTISKWLKGSSRCHKGRRCSNSSYNPRTCNQKDVE